MTFLYVLKIESYSLIASAHLFGDQYVLDLRFYALSPVHSEPKARVAVFGLSIFIKQVES